ncbi:uncharacterized protein LOC127705537 [Mytilus californianus]|uniref:uncharacterized protein LOC127705537 n=1 Tax=Mytilus californianus TaxID=6549 RepID=UPI0022487597|nr:uncharacterized protein LOC127705537 [Mytilus californianus]
MKNQVTPDQGIARQAEELFPPSRGLDNPPTLGNGVSLEEQNRTQNCQRYPAQYAPTRSAQHSWVGPRFPLSPLTNKNQNFKSFSEQNYSPAQPSQTERVSVRLRPSTPEFSAQYPQPDLRFQNQQPPSYEESIKHYIPRRQKNPPRCCTVFYQPPSHQKEGFDISDGSVIFTDQSGFISPPVDWTIPAIISLVFCPCIGLLAVSASKHSRKAVEEREFDIAHQKAKSARNLVCIAVLLGLLSWGYLICYAYFWRYTYRD